ncbi:hypothetical protein DS67_05255 [Mesotoga sp. SC_4PWA21]|nr:hypothetical protein DS67_05255 [Mesotoga sp. SC_4PWA21]
MRLAARGSDAPKNIGGSKAGEDHARSQCPEKHPGTQGPLRGDEKPLQDQTQGRQRPCRDAGLGKNGPGRNAGKDRAGTQGCLRQEARPTSSGEYVKKIV